MKYLPASDPLFENLDTTAVSLPATLTKMGTNNITGYLVFTSGSFDSYCIFAQGRLITAVSSDSERERTRFDAISMLFDTAVRGEGKMSAYRLSPDLSACVHSAVAGEKIIDGEEIRHVDLKGLLERLKNQKFIGMIRFAAGERFALIFYKDGLPIGFYHDKSKSIDTSAEESRNIAGLPGAIVYVYATKPLQELLAYNLLDMLNLDKLWQAALSRSASARKPSAAVPATPAAPNPAVGVDLDALLDDIGEIVSAYMFKDGRNLLEKLVEEAGGKEVMLVSADMDRILETLARAAADFDPDARADEMCDLVRSEISSRMEG